jgi:hypothetical protein
MPHYTFKGRIAHVKKILVFPPFLNYLAGPQSAP